MGVNIQLEVDEHDLSFGESVLKCLEEEGILMFDIDNPQSGRYVYVYIYLYNYIVTCVCLCVHMCVCVVYM